MEALTNLHEAKHEAVAADAAEIDDLVGRLHVSPTHGLFLALADDTMRYARTLMESELVSEEMYKLFMLCEEICALDGFGFITERAALEVHQEVTRAFSGITAPLQIPLLIR